MREIQSNEIEKLYECLESLTEHHNKVSLNHKGTYPTRAHEVVLNEFANQVTSGYSKIAVAEEKGRIVGFCKIDLNKACGYLAYLVVIEEYRNKGIGQALMSWAMDSFRKANIHTIDVKVVAGNEAIHLYEKYGFQLNAQILRCTNKF